MKRLGAFLIFLLVSSFAYAQKPRNGTYTYKVAFEEWNGRSLGCGCTMVIKGDSVTVINNGSLTGHKGETIDKGILLQHKRTGKWIVAHSRQDAFAADIGSCSGGPCEIDIRRKLFWLC